MIVYSVIADGAKIHMTDNYLLAQLVEKEFKEVGYKKPGIMQHKADSVFFYLFSNFSKHLIYIPFSAGSFQFKVARSDWRPLQNSIKHWDKLQKNKNRPYYKLYGRDHVICLTQSQRQQLTWDMVRKSDEYNYNVEDMSNGS